MKSNSKEANLLVERSWKLKGNANPSKTLVLPTNPNGARKDMKVAEMDAIDSWKGEMHVPKLPLKENMENTYFCIFE